MKTLLLSLSLLLALSGTAHVLSDEAQAILWESKITAAVNAKNYSQADPNSPGYNKAVKLYLEVESKPGIAAARKKELEFNAFMKKHGFSSVYDQNDVGNTPLHYAASENATEIAKALLAAGVIVNAENYFGRTPLHKAAEENATETAKALLAAEADVNAKDGFGDNTPLHYAASENATETAKALLAAGADVNPRGTNGWTPLHMAAEENATETAKALLAAEADVNAKDIYDKTPLHYAAWRNATETAKVLRAAGGTK